MNWQRPGDACTHMHAMFTSIYIDLHNAESHVQQWANTRTHTHNYIYMIWYDISSFPYIQVLSHCFQVVTVMSCAHSRPLSFSSNCRIIIREFPPTLGRCRGIVWDWECFRWLSVVHSRFVQGRLWIVHWIYTPSILVSPSIFPIWVGQNSPYIEKKKYIYYILYKLCT